MAVLLETADRKVARTNQAFCDMFSIPAPPEALIGADCEQAAIQLAPLWGDLDAFLARVDEILAGDEAVLGERLELADGRTLERDFFRVTYDGQRGEATWVYRDITVLDTARRTAEEDSRHRSQLLATISHDVRTPMVGIVGMIDLLLQEPLDARIRELVESVQGSVQAMTTMLDNTLDLARVEANRLELLEEDTSICDLVESVAAMVGPLAQAKSLPLIASASPDLPEIVRTDPGRLRQILLNLVSNAVKFTASGAVTLVAHGEGPDLLLTVADTGPGMAHDALGQLFEQFVQGGSRVNRTHGGAGLGLAISHRLTTALGGSIEVDSTLGAGSTFTVRLPDALTGAPNQPIPVATTALVTGPPTAVPAVVAALERMGIAVSDDPRDPAVSLDVVVAGGILAAQQALPRGPGRRLIVLVPAAAAVCPPLAGTPLALPWTRDRLSAALREDWTATSTSPSAALPAGTRVLLAEDEPSNRKILTEMISRLGASVVAVGDGLEAVQAVAADRFDVVLLDLSMPVLDGRRAAVEIRERFSAEHCPAILALTADSTADLSILAGSGFSGQVRKPATSADLRKAIAAVVTGPVAPELPNQRGGAVAVEVLRELADDLGDPEVVELTLDVYLDELPGRLEAMSSALAAERFDALRDAAHSLKSSSQMLGAAALADLCRDLEAVTAAQSRSGRSSGGDLAPTVDALHTEALMVAQWLAEFRESGYPGLSH